MNCLSVKKKWLFNILHETAVGLFHLIVKKGWRAVQHLLQQVMFLVSSWLNWAHPTCFFLDNGSIYFLHKINSIKIHSNYWYVDCSSIVYIAEIMFCILKKSGMGQLPANGLCTVIVIFFFISSQSFLVHVNCLDYKLSRIYLQWKNYFVFCFSTNFTHIIRYQFLLDQISLKIIVQLMNWLCKYIVLALHTVVSFRSGNYFFITTKRKWDNFTLEISNRCWIWGPIHSLFCHVLFISFPSFCCKVT